MRNASTRKDIRRAEKLSAEAERTRVDFVVAAMDTVQGRTWFHSFLSVCGIFDGSFSGNALVEAFAKGQRNIGLMVYNDIVSNCPDSFVQMMREANIKELANDRRNDANPADAELAGSEDGDGGTEGRPDDDTFYSGGIVNL